MPRSLFDDMRYLYEARLEELEDIIKTLSSIEQEGLVGDSESQV
jgi:hypothetical protein